MMCRLTSRLRRNQRGTSTIELALVLPVLGMMTLGSIDFAMAFGVKMKLQQYAQSGGDYVVAGGESAPSSTDVQSEVATVSGLEAANITVTQFTECNAVKIATVGVCPGVSDFRVDYMQIDVLDTYEPILNIKGIADFLGGNKRLTGSVVVRLP